MDVKKSLRNVVTITIIAKVEQKFTITLTGGIRPKVKYNSRSDLGVKSILI